MSSPSSWSGIGRVAAHLDAIAVAQQDERQPRLAGDEVAHRARQAPGVEGARCEQVEAAVESRAAREAQRHAADVAVRIGVRDEREGGAAVADDLEHRIEAQAVLGERPHRRPGEGRDRRAACRSRRGRARPSGGSARRRAPRPPRTRSGARWRGRARSCASGRLRSPAPPRAARAAAPAHAGSTLVPPPGTKPSTVSGRAPFSASLKPPSPEKTTTASVPASRVELGRVARPLGEDGLARRRGRARPRARAPASPGSRTD